MHFNSRRNFLRSSAAVGTGLAAGQFLSNDSVVDAANEVKPLSAAVIGCGGMATFHAQQHFSPWLNVIALCDVDTWRSEAYRSLTPDVKTVVQDHRELLDRDDIDVFVVCTPDHWHTQITVDALRAGKDVYCEKPLTFSIDEGRLIQQVLSETDRVLQVGTQQRSDTRFQTAVALARSNRLGAVKRITAAIGGGPAGGPFPVRDVPPTLDWDRWLGQAPAVDYRMERCHGAFRWWYEYSGGKLTDWGAHHVDIAMWALGDVVNKPVSIRPRKSEHPVPFEDGYPRESDKFNTATSFEIECEFADGALLVIRDQALDLGFENGLLFECENGRFFVNRGKLTGQPVEDLKTDPLPEELFVELRHGRPVMPHMQNFYESCRDRKANLSDAASHITHLNVCHLANISQRLERDLIWDPAQQKVLNDETADSWRVRPQREGYSVQ